MQRYRRRQCDGLNGGVALEGNFPQGNFHPPPNGDFPLSRDEIVRVEDEKAKP